MTDAAVDRAPDADPLSVSIVVPAYNAAATIADTLSSVCAQEWTAWEAIVVDDGSTDDTRAIAEDFAAREPRIRVVRRENGGEAAARNTGIADARFDWLLFLDADDWIAPQHLTHMTAALAADTSLGAVHCLSVRVARDGVHVSDDYEPPAGDLFATLARRAAFPVHACVVRRSLVEAVGRFDPSLRTSPDWDLWQRIARTGARFGAVREVLAFYRMNPQSASLDGRQLFADGLQVLLRGHAADPRVRQPAAEHAAGRPPEELQGQPYYLLSWCAGLMIGAGGDAATLFSLLPPMPRADLFANAIAQCLYESITLPSSKPRTAWEDLWPAVRKPVEAFLEALETHSANAGIAGHALTELKTSILRASDTWRPVLAHVEGAAAELAAGEYGAKISSLDEELARHRERAAAELEAARGEAAGQLARLNDEREAERTQWHGEAAAQRASIEQLQTERTALEDEGRRLLQRQGELERQLEALRLEKDASDARGAAMERERNSLQAYAADLSAHLDRFDATRWVRFGKHVHVLPRTARPPRTGSTS